MTQPYQTRMFDLHDGAIFSEDRCYRYKLWRRWELRNAKTAVVIGLNPSLASEESNDPTVRRCMGFAKAWGCGSLHIMNLFAYITPYPRDLRVDDNWVMNLEFLRRNGEEAIADGGLVLLAWGAFKEARERGAEVAAMFPQALCLGHNADGSPKHPLYIKADTKPILYRKEAL